MQVSMRVCIKTISACGFHNVMIFKYIRGSAHLSESCMCVSNETSHAYSSHVPLYDAESGKNFTKKINSDLSLKKANSEDKDFCL